MKDEIDGISDSRRGTPGWMFAAVAVLGVVALVGLVLAHNASTQAQEIQQALENKVKALQTDFTNQIATIQQHETQTDAANSGLQSDLKMARSELGTLIARNHEDVEQLRRLGEREYIEFTIDTKNKPQKVGAFVVELRGTNLNKKRYTVSLIVDDVHIDKKNMPVNEPVFFHQGSDRRPLELVVNQVAKDKVTGYISVPKTAGASSTASAGGN